MSRAIVALSGSSGFIGAFVAQELKKQGYEVWPLVRVKSLPDKNNNNSREIFYDYKRQIIDEQALKQCSALIHLAGKNIMSGLWTKRFKQEVWESRIDSTKLIATAMAKLSTENGPQVLICASAVGIYAPAHNHEKVLDEKSLLGSSFLAKLCKAWEGETCIARDAGVRVVNTRFGIVLANNGGMFKEMKKIFSMGLGAIIGSGKQYMALVALEDVARALVFALENNQISGPVNVVYPEPISNEEFSRHLAQELSKPLKIRIPAWIFKCLGEQGAMILASCPAVPKALLEAGFSFTKNKALEIKEPI